MDFWSVFSSLQTDQHDKKRYFEEITMFLEDSISTNSCCEEKKIIPDVYTDIVFLKVKKVLESGRFFTTKPTKSYLPHFSAPRLIKIAHKMKGKTGHFTNRV
jgi:hypothetical protein